MPHETSRDPPFGVVLSTGASRSTKWAGGTSARTREARPKRAPGVRPFLGNGGEHVPPHYPCSCRDVGSGSEVAQHNEAQHHSSQDTHEHPSGAGPPTVAEAPTTARMRLPEPLVLPQHPHPSDRMRVRASYDECAGNSKVQRASLEGAAGLSVEEGKGADVRRRRHPSAGSVWWRPFPSPGGDAIGLPTRPFTLRRPCFRTRPPWYLTDPDSSLQSGPGGGPQLAFWPVTAAHSHSPKRQA